MFDKLFQYLLREETVVPVLQVNVIGFKPVTFSYGSPEFLIRGKFKG
jgi:hypothetical protein